MSNNDIFAGLTPPPPELVFHNYSDYVTYMKKKKQAASEMYHSKSDWYAAQSIKEKQGEALAAFINGEGSSNSAPEIFGAWHGISSPARPYIPALVMPQPPRPQKTTPGAGLHPELVQATQDVRTDLFAYQERFTTLRKRYFRLLPHTREAHHNVDPYYSYICHLQFVGHIRSYTFGIPTLSQSMEEVELYIDSVDWSALSTAICEEWKSGLTIAKRYLDNLESAVQAYEEAESREFQSAISGWEEGISVYENLHGPMDCEKLRHFEAWMVGQSSRRGGIMDCSMHRRF